MSWNEIGIVVGIIGAIIFTALFIIAIVYGIKTEDDYDEE